MDNAVVSFVGARFARPKTVCFVSSCRMSLTEVCALLTVVISLLALLVTVAKAAFDAGWKISHEKSKICGIYKSVKLPFI